MIKIINVWKGSNNLTKIISLFVGILVAYGLIYGIGDGALYTLAPKSNEYVIARTSSDNIKDVFIKKTSDSWHIEPISAKNVSHMKVSVGDTVSVQRYWWFGNHTYVKDIQR